eukprot:s62_g6.t1
MVSGIALKPRMTDQPVPAIDVLDVEPTFPQNPLLGPVITSTSSVQPDVQFEDDEPTFEEDVMEKVGYRDSYNSWTGYDVNIPRTPNRVHHENYEWLLRETLTELQDIYSGAALVREWRGTYGTGLALVTALVAAGVALCDIPLRFVWQAWHLRHWAGSGDGLGRRWSPGAPRFFCVAGVVLGDIHLRFVWQAWYGTGVAPVTALVAAGRLGRRAFFAWQAWRFLTSPFVLCTAYRLNLDLALASQLTFYSITYHLVVEQSKLVAAASSLSVASNAMVPGIVFESRCSDQPEVDVVDVEPIFPDQKLLVGPMSTGSSVQPDVQFEDDEPTFEEDVMEKVGYRDSYNSWTGKEVNCPRTPNRRYHENYEWLLRETLTELQEHQHVLKDLVARKRMQDFDDDSSTQSTWLPRWITKLAQRD